MKDTMTNIIDEIKQIQSILDSTYNRGYDKGYNNRKIEEEFEEKSNNYEQGLNDAWELTRKLIISDYDGAYSAKDMRDIWEHGGFLSILKDFTAQQALEKLKKYEEQKKEKIEKAEIHVGDEIYSELTNCKAVVQRIDTWNRYQCFDNKGSQFVIDEQIFNECWVKTGKNYPQIIEILKQMKGDK